MRYPLAQTLSLALLVLSGCSVFQPKQPPPPPPVVPKALSVPVGKNWEVKEEPPVLTNERHERTLPFQRPESVQPPGPPPAPPTEKRTIETPR
jgi:hypothetical protein